MAASELRALIPDLGDPPLLTDDQIEACRGLYPDLNLALAACLELVASNELLLHRIIRTQEIQIDSGALADRLFARAQQLRASTGVVLC